eukprot:15475635-Alexandrium_andersonii.AAC.1
MLANTNWATPRQTQCMESTHTSTECAVCVGVCTCASEISVVRFRNSEPMQNELLLRAGAPGA